MSLASILAAGLATFLARWLWHDDIGTGFGTGVGTGIGTGIGTGNVTGNNAGKWSGNLGGWQNGAIRRAPALMVKLGQGVTTLSDIPVPKSKSKTLIHSKSKT